MAKNAANDRCLKEFRHETVNMIIKGGLMAYEASRQILYPAIKEWRLEISPYEKDWQEENMRVQRRGYDSDFTYNTVKLTDDPEWTVKDVAENPGIAKDLLYKWKHEFRAKEELDFPWNGRAVLTGKEKKIRNLEKWIKDAVDL